MISLPPTSQITSSVHSHSNAPQMDGVIVVNSSGTIISINNSAQHLLQYHTVDLLIGQDVSPLCCVSDLEEYKTWASVYPEIDGLTLINLLRTNPHIEIKTCLKTAKKTVEPVRISAIQLNLNNQPTFFILSLKEMREKTLSASKAKLQSQFKNIFNALLQTSFYDLSILGNPLQENLKLALSIILSAPLLPKQPSGAIFLVNRDEKSVQLACQLGLSSESEQSYANCWMEQYDFGQILNTKRVHFSSELTDHYSDFCPQATITPHYLVPIMREEGRVLGVLMVFLDYDWVRHPELERFLSEVVMVLAMAISRKYFENKLLNSESQFSSIANTSNDGIISINQEGKIGFSNQSANRIFQYEEGELLGQPLTRIIPSRYHSAHKAGIKNALKTGKISIPGKIIEFLGLRKDGLEVPVEISLSMWESNQQTTVAASIRDISERKRMEETLKLQLTSMKYAANSILITDSEGNIEWVNPAFEKLTGFTFDEVVGRNANILNSGLNDPAVFVELWRTIKSGKIWQGHLQNKKKSGELFWEEETITPILDQNNIISHFLAIKVDITAQREIDETLWRAKIALEDSNDRLEKANAQLLEERSIIENIVYNIQNSPLFDRSNLRILEKPIEKTTGDLICATQLSNGVRRILLGDFTGHGLTAAIGGPLATEIFYAASSLTIAHMFRILNERLLHALNRDMFMACSCVELDIDKNQATLFNAGMVNIFILREGKTIHKEPSKYVPRGLMDVPDCEPTVFPIRHGDKIILCTDGFEETTDPSGNMFGEQRFLPLLEEVIANNEPLEILVQKLALFRQGRKQEDDITLIELTCK
ncbi:MAG: PAS domain S-box protein [Magnetococcales bacterium]|nr:PAS domain S-box protein [Magnetococcales bacterium]